MAFLQALFKYIDENQELYVKRLSEWVAVPSVSAWSESRPEVVRMVQLAAHEVTRLGGSVELVDIGTQTMPDGSKLALPPILLATLGTDPSLKTVLIYGHLDVQPARLDDGWDTEPFTLTEKDGKLYGRGSTDDKGPVLGWLNVIEAFQNLKQKRI
ncbi:cytosolic non-specific dipeptidase-like [Lethenteron reissneri]|uniref:cytosolic non-specific dipeptidase-like n=1 Tax=Lethenteron reissneri TaxID=7753 RepID=UPI002AB6292C|nr:cytosolic non-specific dipeptidase-like [Lethenteron reissneri]